MEHPPLPDALRDELAPRSDYRTLPDPDAARVLDALLRRGYLVSPMGGDIGFDQIPHPDDPDDLVALLRPALAPFPRASGADAVLIRDKDGQPLIEIPRSAAAIEAARRTLREDVQRIHVRGHCSYGRTLRRDPGRHRALGSFQETTFRHAGAVRTRTGDVLITNMSQLVHNQ